MLFAVIGYSLPALGFGLMAGLRAWRSGDSLGQILGLFAFFNLVLIVVYPGRQVADLLWVLLPLWTLAATEISRYLFVPADEPRAAFGEAALMLLLLAFFALTLAKVALNEALPELYRPYLFVAGGVILLALAATVLIGFGWSRQAAANGLVWAFGLASVLLLLSASTRFQRSGPFSANDLWAPGPSAGDLSVLATNLHDLSFWDTGQPQALPVDVRTQSAALNWAVRNLPASSDLTAAPPLIITLATDPELAEADSYRGQSFALQAAPAWQNTPPNFFSWLLYRRPAVTTVQAILWANLSLFPDGAAVLDDSGVTP